MNKKSFIFLSLIFILDINTRASEKTTALGKQELEFKANIWLKSTCSQDSGLECLPRALNEAEPYKMNRPSFSQTSHTTLSFPEASAKILWAYRRSNPDYQIFQIELFNAQGKQIALCSRYEKLDPKVQHIPVGACAGSFNDDQLLGLSLYLN